MPKQSRNDDPFTTADGKIGRLPGQAVATVIAGIMAAWFAADSAGFWGYALRHTLTLLAMAVAILAAWPWPYRTWKNWRIFAAGVAGAIVLNGSMLQPVNVLGVVLVLATLAYIHEGLTSRAILLASLAAISLAMFRLALTAVPIVWQFANVLGWGMGRMVGVFTGRQLTIGATFGGVDFIVLMLALYVGWILSIAPPRRRIGIYVGVAIVFAHLAYLIALAYSEKFAASLPDPFYVQETDISRVGAWAWQNALRTFLPWNMPALAMILHGIIAACMFRWAEWLPVAKMDKEKTISKSGQDEVIELRALLVDAAVKFGPVALAVLIAMLTSLSHVECDMKGKTVLTYDKGNFNWLKPEHNNPIEGGYGMLPIFVESLGGRFVKSPKLSQDDLAKADVLIILQPVLSLTDEQIERILTYVRQGGSLLLGAENNLRQGQSESRFNEVLKPAGMEVRYDTTIPLTADWEQSYQVLSHAVTLGLDDLRNRLGFQRGSTLHLGWTSWPVVVGRWGWSTPGSDAVKQKTIQYHESQPLGDLVLAAEQPLGQGRIFVLGDMSCMNNERLSCSYEFIGQLIGYLSHRSSTPQALWRQMSGIATMILLLVLLAKKVEAMRITVTCVVFAGALFVCTWNSKSASPILPDGRGQTPNNLAYIDTSHIEAFSSELWDDYGIAGFTRVLMRNGYLPLRLSELTFERLERAGLLVSMAPARRFSTKELTALKQFVEQGGTFLCLVGAEEARPIAELLEEYQLKISPSPIQPDENIREPYPLGAFRQVFSETNGSRHYVNTYAAWPLEIKSRDPFIYLYWSEGDVDIPVVGAVPIGNGVVAVVADTYFAINRNLESNANEFPDNILFWRWFLPLITGREAWKPPAEPIREQGLAE